MVPPKKKTRQTSICKVFGAPKNLTTLQLPTIGDVIRYYLQIQSELILGEYPSFAEVASVVCQKVREVWQLASIPTEVPKSTTRRLQKIFLRYNSVKKALGQPNTVKASALKRRDEFRAECDSTLFDICACKCAEFKTCRCEVKVPEIEREFLVDQRTKRKLFIDSNIAKKNERKSVEISEEERRRRHAAKKDEPPRSLDGLLHQCVDK